MSRFGLCLLLIVLALAPAARGQSKNAADLYRIAANQLPVPVNAPEKFIWQNVLDVPLDTIARSIVQKGRTSLSLFDDASSIPFGEWGFDPADPLSNARTLVGASELADLVILRARLSAERGKFADALADCCNLALLARRMSIQPSLPRMAQQNELFARACRAAGLFLLDASPADCEEFIRALNNLGPPIDPAVVATTRRDAYIGYYRRLAGSAQLRDLAARSDLPFDDLLGARRRPVETDDLSMDPALAEAAFTEAKKTFDDLTDAIGKPTGERAAAIQKIRDRVAKAHPLVREIPAIFDQIAGQLDAQPTDLALVRAAVDICADPRRPIDEAAARQKAAPHEFTPVDAGFELRAGAAVLRVGSRPLRSAMATTQPSP